MFTKRPNGLWPQWNILPTEKALCFQYVSLWFIVPMEQAWFYERLFPEVVIVMIKD